jgi:phosphoribosylformimino-5-aminoimidazole carboxamide ribotide isomerase
MRIVGVIDVLGGRAVHARGGRREQYAPVGVVAGEPVDGDALALARVYVDRLGVRELYVADLDAIEGGTSAINAGLLGRIATLGAPVWVDAGVTTTAAANAVLQAGASAVIVGLETLNSLGALAGIGQAIGSQQLAFSVDLRDGVPITLAGAEHEHWSAAEIGKSAAERGAGTIIVLDLGRVGSGRGPDLELMAAMRGMVPEAALFAGGGVRGAEDVDVLARAGCDGALVATALLSGALSLT